MSNDRVVFALALLHMDGVGRVTTSRLLGHFDDLEDLRRYPREQVLHRLKGVPSKETLVKNLFDEAFLRDHLAYARGHLEKLKERELEVIIPGNQHWPPGFDDLTGSSRPALLYAYGRGTNLNSPGAAVFARPPVTEAPFEWAQALVRSMVDREISVIGGVSHGFDRVVQKLCQAVEPANRSIMVANCGLAKIPGGLRSTAGQAVRAGGLMISSFPMAHGPYDHDDYERALLEAALASTCVFVEPRPETPEWRAMEWAVNHERLTFVLPDEEHSPPITARSVTAQTPVQDIVLPDSIS